MPDIKLGSLFDGIGVFPLAASRCGIRPVWASEIEKAPISITKRHFPDMAHLGDITKVDGGKIPPVHVITFGSPCQNYAEEIVIPKLLHQVPGIRNFPQKLRNNKTIRSSSIRAQIKSTQTVSRSSPRYQPRFHRVRAWPCGQHRPFESQPASSRCLHGRRSS